MEMILQRLEEAEKASALKDAAVKGAFNELLAQAMGIKGENDQLRESLKKSENKCLELRSDSFLKQTELENVNNDLRESLKNAEDACTELRINSLLEQTELENTNNNLRERLNAAEETCTKQAREAAIMQEQLSKLRHDSRSLVCGPEPLSAKRPCPQDEQPDSKTKLPKLSHTSRVGPSYTPTSPTPQPIPRVVKNEEAMSSQPDARYIYLNRYGERIDPQIHPQPDPRLVYEIRGAHPKLCNNFYINRDCPHRPCVNDHSSRLNREEMDALRYVARLVQCKYGRFCANGKCTAGHSCPLNERCIRSRCKWPPEMHGIEEEVYEKLRI